MIPSRALILVLSLSLLSFWPKQAKAMSMGDAALTVTITTVTGAVLGASTLPFYEESSKHTKNIFYGAALGAVAGVILAAYSGVQEGAEFEEEEAKLRRQRPLLGKDLYVPEPSSALSTLHARSTTEAPLFWSQVARVQF